MQKIIYPGTFDPITMGHFDLIIRASKIYDEVEIVIFNNVDKKTLFTIQERIFLIEKATKNLKNIKINYTNKILADYLKKADTNIVLRGLRTVSDYHYEIQMALNNKVLMPEMEILFMLTNNEYSFISSSTVRELLYFNSNFKYCVPENIYEDILRIYKNRA